MVLYSVKITDFGLSKAIGGGISEAYSLVGTRPYTAPEVLSGATYDFSSDLWGLGVVLYILLAGRFPFNDVPDRQEELDRIVGSLPVSDGGRDLVSGLLELEPSRRLRLDAFCSHEWLQDEIDRPHEPLLKRQRTGGHLQDVSKNPSGDPQTPAVVPPEVELDDALAASPKACPPPTPTTVPPSPVPLDAVSHLAFASLTPAPPDSPPEAAPSPSNAGIGIGNGLTVSYEASEVLPPSKKPDVMQVHMVVPDKLSDVIHGKAGLQMKQIASTVGCQVRTTAPDKISGHRLIIIGNYAQCSIVQELVRSRLADALRSSGVELPEQSEVIVFVRAEAAGVVTGKQQFKLRQICRESGAKIQLWPETVHGQRPCMLSGNFQNVLRAERHVFDLVRAVPVVPPAEKGPDLPRIRISTEPLLGEIVSRKGYVGWIQAREEIDHPQAGDHHGHIYVHQKDLASGGSFKAGQQVSFHVYSDFLGLGAEECYAI